MALVLTHAAIGAATTGLATAAVHQAALDAATGASIDKTNFDSVSKVVTVGTGAPTTDGEETWQTTSLAGTGGPTRRMQAYNGAASVALDFANAYYSASTPASGYQINGQLWYDMTLQLWRVWRDGTYDPNAVAGWHPVSDAYQLWKNEGATDPTPANRVVCHLGAGTAELRTFGTTTKVKDQTVAGVTLESIAVGASGVVAVVSGGANVKVLVDSTEADGAVAKGDFLCTYTAAGQARTAGPQTASGIVAAGNHTLGTPEGAFAVALGVKDGSNLVRCKLLGFVGAGAMALIKRVKILADTTPPTAATEIDCSLVASGTNGAQGAASVAISAKHLPFRAVRMQLDYLATMAAGGSTMEAAFYSDGGTTQTGDIKFVAQGTGNVFGGVVDCGFIPTVATGSTSAAGNTLKYLTGSVNVSSVTTFDLYVPAYIY